MRSMQPCTSVPSVHPLIHLSSAQLSRLFHFHLLIISTLQRIIKVSVFPPFPFSGLGSDSVRYRGNDFVSLTFYKPRISVRPPRVSNRVWLFLVAITVHNIPEGLAVGVAFGTGDSSAAGSALLRAR